MTARPSRTLLLVLVLVFTLPVAARVQREQPAPRQPKTLDALLAAYERAPRQALGKWRTVQSLATGCATPLVAQYRQWLLDKGIPEADIDASALRDHDDDGPQTPIGSTENFVIYASKTTAMSLAPGFVDLLESELELAHAAFFDRYGFKRPTPGLRIRIYVRPGASFAAQGHIHLGTGVDVRSTPAHELFHLSQQATWLVNGGNWWFEAEANWAQDIVSPAHDDRNTYVVQPGSDFFTSPWTSLSLRGYRYSYYFKYLQQWSPTLGLADPGAFDFGVDLVKRLHDRFAVLPGPGRHMTTADWDAALAAEVAPWMTFDLMWKHFVIAAYTKDLGQPFTNYPIPGTFEPWPLITRWDFLEDEEPNLFGTAYPPLSLSQDGDTLRPTRSLSFTNVGDGFTWVAQAEFVRVGLAPERPAALGGVESVVYFKPAKSDPVKVSYAALVQYRHDEPDIDEPDIFVRPVLHLDAKSTHRITVYDSLFPSETFTATHLVVIPYTRDVGDETGRFFFFELSFQKP